MPDLCALLIRQREERELLAVLLEHDAEVFHVGAWRLHLDLERRGDAHDFFRLVDLDGRDGHPACSDERAARGEQQDQHQAEEKTHLLMIPAAAAKLGHDCSEQLVYTRDCGLPTVAGS